MDKLDKHLSDILMSFTISEVLEQMDIDEVELLRYLIDTRLAKLPDFLDMEDFEDGNIYVEGEDEPDC